MHEGCNFKAYVPGNLNELSPLFILFFLLNYWSILGAIHLCVWFLPNRQCLFVDDGWVLTK